MASRIPRENFNVRKNASDFRCYNMLYRQWTFPNASRVTHDPPTLTIRNRIVLLDSNGSGRVETGTARSD